METKELLKETERIKAIDTNTDFEVRSDNAICVNYSELHKPLWSNIKFSIAGILFGIILVKSEVISWFRRQEMFRLQSFHMYGVIGSAIAVGMLSIFLIKKYNIKTLDGETVKIEPKKFNKGKVYCGLIFCL